ncbi:type III-A CRISPR-associated protein Csm2 [Spirochaetia bacterium 38H-sp]|uniref:CRISPR system Cms protein Csm2 n=1 Tax=Rarispira pelagica TaxID=3141764 RepID=A0ABU9U8M0_9SPIR
MKKFYKDDNKTINPELIEEAEENAGKISGISSTQMRRIFNQFKHLNSRIEKEGWEKIEPLVRLQKAQLEYTIKRAINYNKKHEDQWGNLKKILQDGFDRVKTAEDYKVLTMYIEALYAYFYANTNQKN